MARRPVPREPGEDIKLVGFKAAVSMDKAIQARAKAAGMSKSDWLRAVMTSTLADDDPWEGAA